MAKILCDCGCGVTFERPSFKSGACRMKAQRKGIPVRDARVTKVPTSDSSVTVVTVPSQNVKMSTKANGTGNMYGEWVNGAWTPKV